MIDAEVAKTITTTVSRVTSARVGQVTFRSSLWVSRTNFMAELLVSHVTKFDGLLLFAAVMICRSHQGQCPLLLE
jgi:hypothetical protein